MPNNDKEAARKRRRDKAKAKVRRHKKKTFLDSSSSDSSSYETSESQLLQLARSRDEASELLLQLQARARAERGVGSSRDGASAPGRGRVPPARPPPPPPGASAPGGSGTAGSGSQDHGSLVPAGSHLTERWIDTGAPGWSGWHNYSWGPHDTSSSWSGWHDYNCGPQDTSSTWSAWHDYNWGPQDTSSSWSGWHDYNWGPQDTSLSWLDWTQGYPPSHSAAASGSTTLPIDHWPEYNNLFATILPSGKRPRKKHKPAEGADFEPAPEPAAEPQIMLVDSPTNPPELFIVSLPTSTVGTEKDEPLVCGICHCQPENPRAMVPCSHAPFCRKCILDALDCGHSSCPICRTPLEIMWVTELRLAEIQDVIPMSREGSAVIRHLLLAEGLSYVEDVPQWREVLNLHGVKVINFKGANYQEGTCCICNLQTLLPHSVQPCGHAPFCRRCLRGAFADGLHDCPVCNQPLDMRWFEHLVDLHRPTGGSGASSSAQPPPGAG
jgi:hypothetical protein